MTPAEELRLLRRLATPCVALVRCAPDRWSVAPAGDRRRRALASLTDSQVRALTASGAVAGGETRVLTAEGRARFARLSLAGADGEQAFAAQHRRLAMRQADGVPGEPGVPVNLAESPLGRIGRCASGPGALSAAELQAGERLREDLVRSPYNARVTMDWDAPPAGKGAARAGGRDPAGAADAALAARTRVNAALEHVGEPFSGVLLDLLWRELPLQAIERARNWPARTGRLGVKLALARLAQHYGFVTGPSS